MPNLDVLATPFSSRFFFFHALTLLCKQAWNEFDSWLNQQRRCTSMALHDDLEPQSLSSSQSSSSSTALTVGLARPCVLFAHNAPYDINILSHEVRRANVAKNAFGAEPGALPSLRAAGFASSVDTVGIYLLRPIGLGDLLVRLPPLMPVSIRM